jgi:hypothetical protein
MVSKKAALSLPVNMLVMIILSIVIFSAGIALLYQFVDISVDTKEELDQKTKDQIQNLLINQGQAVALPFNKASLEVGQDHLFGVGIHNLHDQASFVIETKLFRYTNSQGQVQTSPEIIEETSSWMLYSGDEIKIEKNKSHIENIYLSLPDNAPKGKYIFNVIVTSDEKQYGNTQMIEVAVK